MKYYELTKQEKKLLKDFEEGVFVSLKRLKDAKKQYQIYAKNTLNKTKNINLRLSQKDIQKLKSKAASAGIPYQTLVSSVIHRFAGS